MYRYINKDVFEKIYDEYPKCYGIRFSENVEQNGHYIGQILLIGRI